MTDRRIENVPADELAEELAQRNGTLQSIMSFMSVAPLPAFLKDANGRVLFINGRGEELFGMSADDMRGKTFPEIFRIERPEMIRGIKVQDRKVLTSPTPLVFIEHFLPERGAVRFSTIKFRLALEFGDEIIGAFAVK